jgi:hypothetical protein
MYKILVLRRNARSVERPVLVCFTGVKEPNEVLSDPTEQSAKPSSTSPLDHELKTPPMSPTANSCSGAFRLNRVSYQLTGNQEHASTQPDNTNTRFRNSPGERSVTSSGAMALRCQSR